MTAPGDRYAFDLDISQQAAARFKARKKQRDSKEKAIGEGKYTKAESTPRLVKRLNRVISAVQDTVAAAMVGGPPTTEAFTPALSDNMREIMQHGAVTPAEINDQLVERVLGATRDFLAVGFFEKGLIASRAVCRIVTNLGGGMRGLGSGFMVTPSLLLTNHHVLTTAQMAAQSVAEFNYQLSGSGATLPVERFTLRPEIFFINDPDLDFALVGLDTRSANGMVLSSYGFCPLIATEGKILVRDPVNIVQHPKGDLKQIAIRANTLLDLPETAPLDRYAHYETDTEQGSSGSPVFNDQWEVIALHHSSVPNTNASNQILNRSGTVWRQGDNPDEIDWISNEGIRTSRLVTFITAAAVRQHEKGLLDEFIAISKGSVSTAAVANIATPPPRTEAEVNKKPPAKISAPAARAPAVSRAHAMSAPQSHPGSASLTIPLTITIGIGSVQGLGVPALAAEAPGQAADMFEASIQPDPDYSNRPGFVTDFLGFETPLPTLQGGSDELKYYHYSVIMNSERKLAYVSAVNLDMGAPFQLSREAKDRWFFDPRIDKDDQIGNELYATNPLDRGHLTRRADAAWGETEEEAQLANDDTFHWTNCSPQHEVFNQSTKANQRGLLLWGTLENYVADQAAAGTQKLSVFNGPVFRDNDRLYRGVMVPKEFYKVIAYRKDDGTPGAVAFILSQSSLIENLPAEAFTVGPYQPFQVKISDLEARTGLNFGTLAGFDPLNSVALEMFKESATASVIAIEGLRNIAL